MQTVTGILLAFCLTVLLVYITFIYGFQKVSILADREQYFEAISIWIALILGYYLGTHLWASVLFG